MIQAASRQHFNQIEPSGQSKGFRRSRFRIVTAAERVRAPAAIGGGLVAGEVGPGLTGLGAKKGREYVIESIVYPKKQIAADYENLMVALKNGTVYAGLATQATDMELLVNLPEDGLVKAVTADIKVRQGGLSAIPDELVTYVSKRELRDLVEFLVMLE